MTAADLYDYEGNIPDMIAEAFKAVQMNVGTLNTPPDLEKPRPRSELMFRPGPATSPPRIMAVPGVGRVIAAHTGELDIASITAPDPDNKNAHSVYRSQIRRIMELDTLRAAVNLDSSPYQLDFAIPTGATQTETTSDGYETSHLTYHLQFSIKQDAFNQLANAS